MRSAKNYLILFLACTTVGAGYFAWRQTVELNALRNAAPTDQNLAQLRSKIWNDRQAAAKSTPADEAEKTGQPPSGTDTAANPDRPRRGPGALMKILDNPDYQTLINLSQKGLLDGRYAALFKSLNLTPQQLEQFKELLVEKQSSLMDVMAAARSQGLDPRTDRDAIRQLYATSQAELDENIKSVLGDSAFSSYKEYEQTLPSRNVVNQLEQRLSYSSSPLSDAQSQQMLSIVAETSKSGAGGNGSPGGGPVVRVGGAMAGATYQSNNTVALFSGGGAVITPDTITRAQTVLDPVQVSALQDIQQEQQAAIQLRRSLRSDFATPNPAGAATTTSPAKAP